MHLTINPLIFLYFLILDSISIVFTTLSTLFLDEHVVETIALQEIDTIVVPFVTLAHAHIGGNHDVSFTIMHTGDVGITGNAKLLREIWGEFTNNGLFLLIIIHGTGDGIAWNGGRRGTDQKTKEREERKKGGTCCIASHEYILGKFRLLWFQEAHGQEYGLCLDDFRLACLYHQWATTLRVWFPINRLNLHTCQLAILSEELQRVNIPAAGTAFLVT